MAYIMCLAPNLVVLLAKKKKKCVKDTETCLFLQLWLKEKKEKILLPFPPLCLIHFDSFTGNVKLTSPSFPAFAPQGVGGDETTSTLTETPLDPHLHLCTWWKFMSCLFESEQDLPVPLPESQLSSESWGREHSCLHAEGMLCSQEGSAPHLQPSCSDPVLGADHSVSSIWAPGRTWCYVKQVRHQRTKMCSLSCVGAKEKVSLNV